MELILTAREQARIAERFRPTEDKMAQIGAFGVEQVHARFATHGASGGAPWAHPKWRAQVGYDDGRAILTGATAGLLRSFQATASDDEVDIGSSAPQAAVQQLGTVGKGGSLPDIRPRKAKAMFVPLSDRAEAASQVQTAGQMRRSRQPAGLIQGRFVHGKIEPANADYVFLPKISIPPRQMLPDSEHERADQGRFVTAVLKS